MPQAVDALLSEGEAVLFLHGPDQQRRQLAVVGEEVFHFLEVVFAVVSWNDVEPGAVIRRWVAQILARPLIDHRELLDRFVIHGAKLLDLGHAHAGLVQESPHAHPFPGEIAVQIVERRIEQGP